ncbi:uncharacterized protein LOC123526560 [Mercenaria mercenaria]|uniref:uncharacterized protein LOC123526560 n=1 Tax=Mercenaria mercenaria TaxID=6596 RepID=UPI00234EE2B5|nr:uncharacterized protein LOC123526560 [Mercenaria mercenaria]
MSYECIWTDNNSLNTKLKDIPTEHKGNEFVLTDVKYVDARNTENESLLAGEKHTHSETEVKKKSNLDKYLDDLYEKELVFHIDQEETELIQTGVETLVKELIRVTRLEENEAIQQETIKVKAAFNYLQSIDEESLEDAELIKVGSFYEGAQNAFPNDFDFVFVLGNFRSDRILRSVVRYEDARYDVLYDLHYKDRDNFVHNALRTVSTRIRSIYFMEDNRDRMVADEETINLGEMEGFRSIVFDKYVIIDEKASKLRFIYQNEFGHATYINVNIIPAFRVYETPGLRENDEICKSPFVSTEVARTGSVLIVSGLVWFSQSEVDFMNNVLSKRHKKVYRIIKYLVGGRMYTDAIYENLVETGLWRYNTGIMSSYMVKALIISHHYICKRDESEHEAPCVIDILTHLKDIKSNKNVQLLTDVVHTPNFFRSEVRYNRLRDMLEVFQTYQRSCKPYCYESCTTVPINKALLDCFGTRVFRKALPKPADIQRKKERPNAMVAYCPVVINYLLIIALVLYVLVSFHILTGYFGEPYP